MSVLFVNACVREESRTLILAREVLKKLDGDVVELELQKEKILPLDGELLARRDLLCREEAWEDPMLRYARQFAEADEIVIAAPYWDLGFPALLKIYLEAVSVVGITFRYSPEGIPVGLCRAKKLTYVTTVGGQVFADFGYSYVKMLAQGLYGIPETVCCRAENLDVQCITAERFLQDAVITEVP